MSNTYKPNDVDRKPWIVFTGDDDHLLDGECIKDKTITGDKIADGTIGPEKLDHVTNVFQDGYYPEMTVGTAESLIGEVETNTFATRTTDSADGVAHIQGIKGNTVRWNQRYEQISNAVAGNDGTKSFDSDTETWTITCTNTSSTTFGFYSTQKSIRGAVGGHKTFIRMKVKMSANATLTFGSDTQRSTVSATADTFTTLSIIVNPTNTEAITCYTNGADGLTMQVKEIESIDLTQAFGAGNEPATVAEFEQLFPESYYPYDTGILKSVQITGITTEDSGGNALDTQSIPVSTYFPTGMKSAGTVHDELTENAAVTKISSRAYESGDEDDATVITDGTTTYYALTTPTTQTIDPPLNLRYRVTEGGTEEITTASGVISAPPTFDTAYPLDMRKAYISKDSFDNFCTALGTAISKTITATYNSTTQEYEYTIS